MLKTFSLVTGLLLALCAYWYWGPGSKEITVTELPVLIGCQAHEQTGVLTFRGELRILARAQQDPGGPEQWLQDQFSYFFYSIHYLQADPENRIFLSGTRPEFKLLRREVRPYGQDLPVNGDAKAGAGIYASFWDGKRGIRAQDPALWLEYEAKLAVRTCGPRIPKTLVLPLPLDPYAQKITVVDEAGERERIRPVQAEFVPTPIQHRNWSYPGAWEATELRLTFLFGPIGNKLKAPNAVFKRSLELATGSNDWQSYLDREAEKDAGLRSYFEFILSLPLVMDQLRFTPQPGYLAASGTLRATGQRLHLRLRYGDSDMVQRPSEEYARFVLDALQDSQFFLYLGVTRQGRNTDLRQLARLAQRPWKNVVEELRRPAHRFYGLAGSYSLGTFAQEVRDARQGLATDILLSASSHYMHDLPHLLMNVLVTHSLSYPRSWERNYFLTWERLGSEQP